MTNPALLLSCSFFILIPVFSRYGKAFSDVTMPPRNLAFPRSQYQYLKTYDGYGDTSASLLLLGNFSVLLGNTSTSGSGKRTVDADNNEKRSPTPEVPQALVVVKPFSLMSGTDVDLS